MAKFKEILKRLQSKFDLKKRLSPHFTLKEFICGTNNSFISQLEDDTEIEFYLRAVEQELTEEIINNLRQVAAVLEIVRAYFGHGVIVTCGFRPLAWEKYKNRSGQSQHRWGKAADFYIFGRKLTEVYKFVDETFKTGGRAINLLMGFVHFDLRFDARYHWEY